MERFLNALSNLWQTFMEYNKQFDGTLFIVLVFLIIWKMLGMLESNKMSDEAVKILLEYSSVFSHILSTIAGALFMKLAMDANNGK